jgi:microcystin-dependent protein
MPEDIIAEIESAAAPTLTPVTTWADVPLEGAWQNYGSGYPPAQFAKDSLGNVELRGRARYGSLAVPIGTLPEGFRPEYAEEFLVPCAAGSARVEVHTDGRVLAFRVPACEPGLAVMSGRPTTTSATGEVLLEPGILYANGAAVLRIGDYAGLFAKYGTNYGAGNGTTTFNVPDLRDGRNPVAAGPNFAINSTGGEKTHALVEAEMPSHNHGLAGQHQHQIFWDVLGSTGPFSNPGFLYVLRHDGVSIASSYNTLVQPAGQHEHAFKGNSQPFSAMGPYRTLGAWGILAWDVTTWVSLLGVRFRAVQ